MFEYKNIELRRANNNGKVNPSTETATFGRGIDKMVYVSYWLMEKVKEWNF